MDVYQRGYGRDVARTQGVLSQAVVVLNFDDKGVLREVKKLGGTISAPVSMVARTTAATEASFL